MKPSRARAPARALLASGAVLLALLAGAPGCSEKDPGPAPRPELALGRSPEYDYDPPEPGTYSLPVLEPATGGKVLDASGTPHELRDLLEGHVTILSFVYTRCRDPRACPMATGTLAGIQALSEQDPDLARNLRLLTFSFDPEHDTPRVMAEYAGHVDAGERNAAEWLFLTTAGTLELEPILNAYGQRVDRKRDSADPLGPLFHNLRVYLIDREARIRNIYSYGLLDPRLLLADVRTLLLEDADRAGIR